MKLPAFDYAAPATLREALDLLAAHPGAKPLAGGQSLIPTMAFRLATPPMLVDLGNVRELEKLTVDANGVHLGARVRWRDIADHPELKRAHPLLVEAISHVAHYQIRNRGTVGGSLAHADPAAEMPGIAVTCDAQILVSGKRGPRTIAAGDFFTGALSTAIRDDELIVEVRLPGWPTNRRWAFEEFSRRRGDFALAGIAVYYDLDSNGRAGNTHVGVIGACLKPHRVRAAEAALDGQALTETTIAAAARTLENALEAPSDLHASAAYRRSLAATLLERALLRTL
ncbi:MAG TPA: xanthine dehydrogenase family protein subunit M [Burkholderiales bacterium]|nr:xanthine dehydrogenase family protein subunit M [Burkholderiales bacterium]